MARVISWVDRWRTAVVDSEPVPGVRRQSAHGSVSLQLIAWTQCLAIAINPVNPMPFTMRIESSVVHLHAAQGANSPEQLSAAGTTAEGVR